ncbi:MAG: hypothetical protein BWY31_01688 [Lentisphaerae bacterium ADurb.Bin242]|nr:MAG: hypothetical protein BWY31_01688 [Lentisphaerae bacterium ADurb.Bin242]
MKFKIILAKLVLLLSVFSSDTYATEKLELDEQQTLGLTNCDLFDIWNAYHGANKNALPAVRKIIGSGIDVNIDSTCKLLGMIGTKEDFSFIKQKIIDGKTNFYTNLWIAAGVMSRRNIKEAEQLINQAFTTEFWDKIGIYKYSDDVLSKRPELKYDYFYDVFVAYLISGKGDPEKLKKQLLERIEDDKIKNHLQRMLNSNAMNEFVSGILSGKRMFSPKESSGRPSNADLLKILDHIGYMQLERYGQKISRK